MRPLPPVQGIVAALVVLIAGCGGGSDADPSAGDSGDRLVIAQLADGFAVELVIPGDWEYTDDHGLVAALESRDLDLGEPVGPRISIGVDRDGMQAAFATLPAGSTAADAAQNLEVIDDPADVEVAGYAATQLTLRQGTTTRRHTVVSHHGSAHLIVAEAPAALWPEADAVLATLISTSLKFESPSPAAAATTATTSPPTTQPKIDLSTSAGPSTTDATTQSPDPPGFETPQQAIWSELGYEDNEILNCNSGHAGATKPCWDFLDVTDGDETTPAGEVFWFRPHYGEYHWVLVAEPVEGCYQVADVVAVPEDADPFEHPFP